MGKRSFKINKLPKYWEGGKMGQIDYANLLSGAANTANQSLGNGNQEFFDKYRQDEARTEEQVNAGINAVGAIPGWGTIIAGGLKAGQAVGKATKDEFGIYKSKAGEFFDKSFNPTEGIAGLKRAFDDPSFDNIANQLSLGLVGKNTRQEELKHQKKIFEFDNMTNTRMANETAGARLRNSLPVYQAPAYGKEGLKLNKAKRFSSKFSNFK